MRALLNTLLMILLLAQPVAPLWSAPGGMEGPAMEHAMDHNSAPDKHLDKEPADHSCCDTLVTDPCDKDQRCECQCAASGTGSAITASFAPAMQSVPGNMILQATTAAVHYKPAGVPYRPPIHS